MYFHIGPDRINGLGKKGLLHSLSKVKLPRCESSLASKAIVKPFGKASRALSPLEIIHSDICRPMNVKARHKASISSLL